MKFQTLSLISGTKACNARCPYCVSKMTGSSQAEEELPYLNTRNFNKCLTLAWRSSVNTVIITGKGEPLLFPRQVNDYISFMSDHQFPFPFIELQTNGISIGDMLDGKKNKYLTDERLSYWYNMGLTTILISVAHYDPEMNRQIYTPHRDDYIDLREVALYLRKKGFTVRFTVVGVDGLIDTPHELETFMLFADSCGVNQVTWRPVAMPDSSENEDVKTWTKAHSVSESKQQAIRDYVRSTGTVLRNLAHGAVVYDLRGKNLCMTDCLTSQPDSEEQRQLIFFPDGTIRTDWTHNGSILLNGEEND
jgi:molybdenum cofactor biosynthesis enzyme MoaA